jgi:hypothetical protein
MTVEILRLSGLEPDDALDAAEVLLDVRTGPRRLSLLLMLDDVDRLIEHGPVYQRLISGRRVGEMLCVAAGSLSAAGGKLALPENLAGSQGAGVVWVGDELGIDWRLAAPTADGHVGSRVSGLDRLVELLSDDDVFNHVHTALMTRIPGKVASPGLWLAGADAEDATFAAALGLTINQITQPGAGTAGPFAELLPCAAGGAVLAPAGKLARDRDEVAERITVAAKALGRHAGLGGIFKRGSGGASGHVIEAGTALGSLHDRVARLLRDANAAGKPTDNQYQLIQAAGLQFPPAPATAGKAGGDAAESPVYRAVAGVLRDGDALPLILERLVATERGLERKGSASYMPEVEKRCPRQLLARLADPPQRPSMQAADGGTRGEVPLDDVRRAADALTELTITVANREWSPITVSDAEVARARVALSSAANTLISDVRSVSPDGLTSAGIRRTRLARRAETLRPVLCDLVLRVVASACDSRGASGTQSRTAASDMTARLIKEWKEHVRDHGMSEPPPFAATDWVEVPVLDASEGDVTEIREAVLYKPDREMWQLCLPDDLGALDVSAQPHVVRFAPRLNRDVLAGTLPTDTVWTSSGAYAGLLRLVPLKDKLVTSAWHGTSPASPHDQPKGL